MDNGEWIMENGEWIMDNGEWRMDIDGTKNSCYRQAAAPRAGAIQR